MGHGAEVIEFGSGNAECGMRNAENLSIADRIRIDRIPSFDIRPASFH